MTNVIIVVKDGRVEEVFCRNKNVEVEVLDMDTQDPDELKERTARYENIRKSKSYKDIL